MKDYIVRATAGNTQIRAFAAVTTNLVEEARVHHQTSPVATAALGRLLTGGVMMGSMMKNDTDMLTIQIKCSGDIEGLTVTADSQGNVKGYVFNPDVMLPPKNGKLDVGGALGQGVMTIIKDMGLKEPYSGQTILQTGEIAEDLTYYFATSEQVPSSVGLGVLMNGDNTVRVAGGFIVQVMPFIEDEVLNKLEENIKKIRSVTAMLDDGHTPEQMLEQVLDEVEMDRGLISPDSNVHPKAPGMKYRHYAPKADLIIVEGEAARVREKINELVTENLAAGKKAGVIGTDESLLYYKEGDVRSIGSRKEEITIAQHLYSILRDFDESDISVIYSESFETPKIGQAIMNRLIKAAGHQIIKV